jgi:hypothetical protein
MKNIDKSRKKFHCEKCHYYTSNKYDFNIHLSTAKHIQCVNVDILEITSSTNPAKQFHCEKCDYYTNRKSFFDKHLLTIKHKNNATGEQKQPNHKCNTCNKEYLNYSGLWKHKKTCFINTETNNKQLQNTISLNPEIFLEVLKESKEIQNVLVEQNKELQNKLLEKENQLLEQNKELQNKLLEQNKEHNQQIIELAKNQSIVNNNNTTNQQFNLQFFLNETCKDAMNIVDFVNSLQLTTDDFETTGKLGFVDGISRIFIKELKKIDTEKLPIHCTDFKRETVYIKDNNTWEKENDEKKKLKWTIDRIAKLNYNQIQQWQEKFPECRENNTPANEYFFRLARVALGGYGKEEEDKFREKIMKNILKEVVLDKKQRTIQGI